LTRGRVFPTTLGYLNNFALVALVSLTETFQFLKSYPPSMVITQAVSDTDAGATTHDSYTSYLRIDLGCLRRYLTREYRYSDRIKMGGILDRSVRLLSIKLTVIEVFAFVGFWRV